MVDRFINTAPVTVFSKSYCPFCIRVKNLLKSTYNGENNMKVMEIDREMTEEHVRDTV